MKPMPLVQHGFTLNSTTGDLSGVSSDHYNAVMPNGNIALYIGNNQTLPSVRFVNEAGELVREVATPGFNAVRDMVALPDGGLFLLGFPNPGVANGGLVAQVINADGSFRTPSPVTITTNSVGQPQLYPNPQAVLLPDGEVYVAWHSEKDFSTVFSPLVTRFTGGGAGTSVGAAPAGVDIYAGKVNPGALTNIGLGTLVHAGVETGPDYQVADRRAGAQFLGDLDLMADGDVLITFLGDRYTYNGAAVRMSSRVEIDPDTGTIVVPSRIVQDNPVIGTQTFQGTEYQFAKSVMLGSAVFGSFAARSGLGGPPFTYAGQMIKALPDTGLVVESPFIGLNFTAGSPIASFDPLPFGANDFVAAYTFFNTATNSQDIKIRQYNASGVVQSEIDVANSAANEWVLGFSKGADNSFIVTYRTDETPGTRVTKRYVITETGGVQSVTDGSGNSTINLGAANDWGSGGAGADTINGLNGNDHLFGDAGSDVLSGANGDDRIFGGNDGDILDGGAGADVIDGGEGVDTVMHQGAGASGVAVNLGAGFVWDIGGAFDAIANVENAIGTNNAWTNSTLAGFSDFMTGSNLANTLSGLGGTDYIDGAGGNDVLFGGDALDYVVGGAGNDTLFGEAGNDYLDGGDGNDDLHSGTNTAGLNTYDYMFGRDGNDRNFPGTGAQYVIAGAGADQVYVQSMPVANEVDFFLDFTPGTDQIVVPVALQGATSFIDQGSYAAIAIAAPGGSYFMLVFGGTAAQVQAGTFFV
jgi:Ca2+-binding RTX toxin-like protein